MSVELEGEARQAGGGTAGELLAHAADTWQYGIRPAHKKQESYHEGQVRTATALPTWRLSLE